MDEPKFGWNKVSIPPKPEVAVILAVPSLDGEHWGYFLGAYFKGGSVWDQEGQKFLLKKDGYYIYSNRFDTVLPMENVKYWTHIEPPSYIEDEIVIVRIAGLRNNV